MNRNQQVPGERLTDPVRDNSPLYACFDFRFASEIPLGELTPAGTPDEREVVTIRRGSVPALAGGGLEALGDDARFEVPNVARYLIRGGREIVVEAFAGASERDVRLFLLGSALGVLTYQRGLLPLHANAIVVDDGAYAFSGPSGAGKSTLAAHFATSGLEVLCDDVCGVSFDEEGRPIVWPGLPRLKLWEDAARAFDHDPAALDRVVEGHQKFHVAIGATHAARVVPLRRLYTLARAEPGASGAIVRLTGSDAMVAVMANTYRGGYLATMGLTEWHFGRTAAMLRHVHVYAVTRAWGYDVFADEADRIEEHVRAPT